MTSIEVLVAGAEINAKVRGLLTGGMVGVRVYIRYDKSWDGLIKTLVCRSSVDFSRCDEVRTVLDVGTEATVAHEVMIAGRKLYLGLEGRNADGTEVYPTIWADCGIIQAGANTDADPTVEATPELWEQLQVQMGSLHGLNTDNKGSLVAAINEAMTKGNGLPGKDGRGIASVTGNEDGSWQFFFNDGTDETVSNEAYMAITEQIDTLALDVADKEQLAPEFANSIEECTDTSKLYVLPDGYIYAYMATAEANYTNQIKQSINADGSQYVGANGEEGYKVGYRLNSSGTETAQTGVNVTGFIPAGDGDTVYFKNVPYKPGSGLSTEYLVIYNSSFSQVIGVRASEDLNSVDYLVSAYTTDENGDLTAITLTDKYGINDLSYIRICATGLDHSAVITVNEEIVESIGYSWKNTGHAFVPADYEDRIIKAETDITTLKQAISGDMAVYGIVDSEKNIIMTGTLESGTYSLKYMAEDGTTTDIGEFTME